VEFVLHESGAKVLIMQDRWGSVDYTARVERLRAVETLEHLVIIGEAPFPGTTLWRDLPGNASGYALPAPAPEDVCLLAYTSGTTAKPKGAQHTHQGFLAEVGSGPRMLGLGGEHVQLMSFPCGHVAGLCSLFRTLALGTATVLMDGWNPQRALELIPKYGVTYTSGTPLHLTTLLEALEAGAPLGTLREFLVGAASVPSELVARAERQGITAFRAYGSTEHPTISSATARDPLAKRQFTDGRPTPGTEVRVVDENGADVPAGADGEVVCRGPEQFVGYRDPSLNEGIRFPGGWLRTGDIGRLDAEGYLTITDRIKDVIIRGGETISSREVEDVLLSCPGIADAAAIAVPDERYGEKVGAVVIPEPGVTPGLDTIRAHFAATGVATQKTPEFLEVVDELPRTSVGKVRKADLRARLAAKAGAGPGTVE
jgi:acyl-CoA synthetase (AMP-forming)/AMP-acid ligase II